MNLGFLFHLAAVCLIKTLFSFSSFFISCCCSVLYFKHCKMMIINRGMTLSDNHYVPVFPEFSKEGMSEINSIVAVSMSGQKQTITLNPFSPNISIQMLNAKKNFQVVVIVNLFSITSTLPLGHLFP